VVDLSASTGLASEPKAVLEQIEKLVASGAFKDGKTSYGLIVFGEKPYIEQSLNSKALRSKISDFQTLDFRLLPQEGTDIAAALRLALDTFPEKGAAGTSQAAAFQIILLSDGNATIGELEGVLARAAKEGVRISVLPTSKVAADSWLESMQLPEEVAVDMPFIFKLVVGATEATAGRIILLRDGGLLFSKEVELEPGLSSFQFTDKLAEPGNHLYQAYIKADKDSLPQNDTLSSMVAAAGGPQILLLDQGAASSVAKLLESSGYKFVRKSITDIELNPAMLGAYKAVVLDNWPLNSLSEDQIMGLKSYVDAGGGLFVIQGQRAVADLGPTPLEDLLPVTYAGPQRAQIPVVAVIFLLDKSGSMAEYAGAMGIQKIELLKEAAARSAEVLKDKDNLGIIAFDREFSWLVEPSPAVNKEAIYAQIKGLHPGGGTDLYAPLQEAFARMKQVEARIKHIIVFSDGKVLKKGRDFEGLFAQIKESNITVSAIGLGDQPDVEMLQSIADAGKGKLYLVQDLKNLPQVSLQETRRIARSRWVTGHQEVKPGPYAYLLQGMELSAIPPLDGYALTYEKATAQTALSSSAGDPLLSFWQYGLGKVAVLNTDLEGRGSPAWASWESLPKLLGQIISQVYSESQRNKNIMINTEVEGSKLRILVDVQEEGVWLDLLDVKGFLSGGKESRKLRFSQVAPGRYLAEVANLNEGVYLLAVSAKEFSASKAISIPYREEFRRIGLNEPVLARIAAATGGEYLEDEIFSSKERGEAFAYKDLWPFGLVGTIMLFVAELIFRKLPL